MPALPSAGWHRVTRALPGRLDDPIWDAKTRQTFALEGQRVFVWDGNAWRLTPTRLGEGRSVLVAHPDGIHVVRVDGRALFIHPLAATDPQPIHTVADAMRDAKVQAAWHPTLKQLVLNLTNLNADLRETWAYTGSRFVRRVAQAPSLSAMGWDGARMAGVDDRRIYYLDGASWRLDPEGLPGNGQVFAPDGALWIADTTLKRRVAGKWQSLARPTGEFALASLGFDVARDQVLLRKSDGPDGRRTWVSAGGRPFAPIDMGPWWRPTTESFGVISRPTGLRHIHGRTGAISRLTATGWRLEVAGGLTVDPEWGATFDFGRWGDSLLRLDPDGTLWRSNPWRRLEGEGPGSPLALIGEGPRLIAHAVDRGATHAFEGGRWRQLSASRDRADIRALVETPKGIYLGGGYSLWRLVGDDWQHVARSEAVSIEQMAFDAKTGALLAVAVRDEGADALMVFEAGGWRVLATLPDEVDAETVFGVDSELRRAVLMTEAGEVWMLDLDQQPYQGTLPIKALAPSPKTSGAE